MIIIQLAGGLGNQMFQYALYLQLKSLGKDVKIDDVAGFAQDEKRDPALKPFGIDYERPTRKELIQMLDSSPLPWNRVRRKLCGRNKKSYFEEDKRFHPEIMTWDDVYLEGYWQTEKYFAEISDEIRRTYDTDKLLQYIRDNEPKDTTAKSGTHPGRTNPGQMTVDDWLVRITSTESVSVHIRRGDYLLPENQELFGGICTVAYYENAMGQIRREYPNCRFYVFTNDKGWVKEQIALNAAAKKGIEAGDAKETNVKPYNNIEVVDLAKQSDYAELALMSKCKHNILANSSFSWWASYLNANENKTVLVPDRWLNGWNCDDLYRKDMQRVTATKGISAT